MQRHASIKNGRITIISNHPFEHTQVLIIPPELDDVSNEDLMLHYTVRNNQIVANHTKKPANQLKVALVGNYRMVCGISTYNEHLFPEIAEPLNHFKLFIEQNDFPTGDIYQLGDQHLQQDQVLVCWKRGEPLSQLVKSIKAYDPDIVFISHEWGLFPNARHWLSFLTQLSNYRIIVALHSVFPNHSDKIICEAAIPEIIVHQDEAKNALQQIKGIQHPIHVVGHGCYQAIDTTKLWNLYQSKHTFIQCGFGFHYKRFQHSLQAVKVLKAKYPDVFFTALFSESPQNKMGHQLYFDELTRLTQTLDIQDNVAIIRGYQSDITMDAYLRTNMVAVFPYSSEPGHEVYGSSGAARLAMSKGIPVITSHIPHFTDLPSIKAETPEQIAEALDGLFSNQKAQQEQIETQLEFIKTNSWQNVAQKMLDIFSGSVILSDSV